MQNQKGGFRIARQEKPKEQVEYDEASKNLKVATTKMRLAQQGVDTSSMSRQDLDRVMSLFDKMDTISTDVRNKTSEIQRDANTEIQKINQKANEKYAQVSKDIDTIVNKIKKIENVTEKPAELAQVQQVEIKEETRTDISPDQIKEDLMNTFVNRTIEKMRKELISAFEDYTNIPQVNAGIIPQVKAETVPQAKIETALQATEGTVPKVVTGQVVYEKAGVSIKEGEEEKTSDDKIIVGKGMKVSKDIQECLVDATEKMAKESNKVEPGERPDDKDIPVITPEMIQKTQD